MRKYVLWIAGIAIAVGEVAAQSPFTFYGKALKPGTKTHELVELSDGKNKATIPVTIFHGASEGPVLGITAGVHGYEYPPILAGQQLTHKIDPGQLSGTVILVQVANTGAFLGRTPFLNPADGKNLNRSFPGNAKGTITERIADFISREVISKCDYFLDMHAGDAPEDLMPYTAYYHSDDMPEISEKGRLMATNMGFDHIVVFNVTGKTARPSTYCSAEAFKAGIPAMDIECGGLGRSEEQQVGQVVKGVQSLLKQLKMLEGQPLVTPSIAVIKKRSYLSSDHKGIFYAAKTSGDYVVKGMHLGYITDFFGNRLQDIYADQSGVVLIILGTPPVNEGETVAVIGSIESNK
ncbi:M14 family metallopeptidase [Fulvivirga ulvae]|uniref:succinylglutamate desuccinylase/aspartoacylase family protein n=1 Tax=Fulvivirga ulvae TaxID=2904245 RepID=UPI001F1E6457|nr:M14 family metallopeptidase [Fulvivirga ulvae]UII34544.1 M14 family metallopeptidase [Fulvivirga ulvae]